MHSGFLVQKPKQLTQRKIDDAHDKGKQHYIEIRPDTVRVTPERCQEPVWVKSVYSASHKRCQNIEQRIYEPDYCALDTWPADQQKIQQQAQRCDGVDKKVGHSSQSGR